MGTGGNANRDRSLGKRSSILHKGHPFQRRMRTTPPTSNATPQQARQVDQSLRDPEIDDQGLQRLQPTRSHLIGAGLRVEPRFP